LGQRIFLPL